MEQDEKESGIRKILNFGHTFAHGFEKTLDVNHGQAVAAGMRLAADLSVKKNFLDKEDRDALVELIAAYNLPVSLQVNKDKLLDAMLKDKKRSGEIISFVLINSIGNATIVDININELGELIDDLC